jgi:uncharacterized protein (DUF488 family)
MYYRQKTLIAVIEAYGGKLKITDLQKLMFLFCQQAKESYYDFFPYKYGGYSILVYQDKKRLIKLGLLKESEYIQLSSGLSFFPQLELYDQIILKAMTKQINALRGKALIHKTYLDYPRYTCRSIILPKILNPEELEKVKSHWNPDNSPCLFTIGYEGLTVDAYLGKLILNNIGVLIDVRKNPFSRKPGFSKSQLEHYMKNIGVFYYHLPDLGIPSDRRHELNCPEDYNNLFKYYETEILPRQEDSINTIKSLLNEHHRVALTCFEADFHFCHRHKITDYLHLDKDFKIRIKHI